MSKRVARLIDSTVKTVVDFNSRPAFWEDRMIPLTRPQRKARNGTAPNSADLY